MVAFKGAHVFTGFLRVRLPLFLPFLATIVAAQKIPPLKTVQDVGAFMQTYYLQPRPELIEAVVDALPSTGFLRQPGNEATVMGFFSEIFAANPDRLAHWQIVMAKQDTQTKAALDRALRVSKTGGALTIEGHSAEVNDAYWAAFFASGDSKFIYKLIDQLRYFDERDDFQLFGAGGTAMWSLASNAQSQPRVKQAIAEAKGGADKRTQELITELLGKDPELIRYDVKEIVKKQKESGKWR